MVCAGLTDFVVTAETSPTPLSIVNDVAPETLQDKLLAAPAVTAAGLARKLAITGAAITEHEAKMPVFGTAGANKPVV